MLTEGVRCSNLGLSDRMSRSEFVHRFTLPLTALQMMTTDIVIGIIESRNLEVLAVCSQQAGWALPVAAAVWASHSSVLPWYSWFVGHRFFSFQPPDIRHGWLHRCMLLGLHRSATLS